MDNKQNIYVYNPVQPNKDIGRRTGIPIRKKRNVCTNIDNFDDYFTDSDEEKSINVTQHMLQSAMVNADVSHRQESETASSSGKSNVVKAKESCLQEGLAVNNEPFLCPEGIAHVRVINPLTVGSRFGRRTGKDVLAKKANKMLAGGMDNFSDYLSDSSDISVSLHVTQIQSPEIESLSTSAKESDGRVSPEVHKDGQQLLKSPNSVHIEKSPLFYAPNNSVIFSSGGKNVRSRIFIHNSSRRENTTNVVHFSNQPANHNISVAEQHSNYPLTGEVTSGYTRNGRLQSHCSIEESPYMNSERLSALQSGNDRIKLNNSGLKRNIHDAEDTRVSECTPEVVNSFPEKENMVPRSSSRAGKLLAAEVPALTRESSDHTFSTEKNNSKVNLSVTQEESLDSRSYKKTFVPTVCQTATIDSAEVRCLILDGDKTKTDCSVGEQYIDTDVQKKKEDSSGASERSQRVVENEGSNSEPKSSKPGAYVHILNTFEGMHAVNEPKQLIRPYQIIDDNNQSGASRNLAKSPAATLNFGGDVTGSVSNSEKAIAGQFFGIKKRLSYSTALIDSDQENEKQTKISTQTKILSDVKKRSTYSVGSFVDHHSKISIDSSSTVSGTFVTLTSQNVSQFVAKAKQVEPLASLNTSIDSVDEFCILEEDATEQNVSKVDDRSKKTHVSNNTSRKTKRYQNNNEASRVKQVKTDESERNAKSYTDIQMTNDLSGRQDEITQESQVGRKRRVTAKLTKEVKLNSSPMVSSFLNHHDKPNVDHPSTVLTTSNFISLAPRRVSQLVAEVKKAKLSESLNTSTDSSDYVYFEEILKEPKPSKTLKQNKQIQEVNKIGKRKTEQSTKQDTFNTNIDTRKRNRNTDDKCKIDSTGPGSMNNKKKVLKNRKGKKNKAIKKWKTIHQEKMDENEATNVHNNTKDISMKETSTLQEIHETSGKLKEEIKFQLKQTKGDFINVETVKQLKEIKTPDVKIFHPRRSSDHERGGDDSNDLPSQNNIVQRATRSTNAVLIDNHSEQNNVRSRHRAKPVQYPLDKLKKKHKKAITKVKRAAFGKIKNQKLKKSQINATDAKQKHNQIKAMADSSSAESIHNNLYLASGIDNVNTSATQPENDSLSMKSNNSACSLRQTAAENGENNYIHIEKSVQFDSSANDCNMINDVAKQMKGKLSTESCIDSQQCDLNEYDHLSPLREPEIDPSRNQIFDLSVPVNLSSGNKIAAKRLTLSRKRKSFKKQTKRKSIFSSTAIHEDSTPVKLQLLSSLPKITPQSGISFIRSRRFTFTNTNADKQSPVEVSTEAWENEEHSTPRQKQQQPPGGLSSCLRNKDSVQPRRIARRVRISNYIDQRELSQDNNKTDHSAEETMSNLPSPNSSPVHYGETTTRNVFSKSKSPKIILPDLSYKIVRPNEIPQQGLRRSARTKVMRINAYKGEEIIYRRDSTGFGLVVDGIQPSIGEARVKAKEAERRRKLKERKLKAMKVPAKPAKRLSTHWNVEQNVTSATEIPVVNPDNNEKVLLELIARGNSATWYGPDLGPVTGTEPVALCLHLKQPMFTTGDMHMRALAEKPYQLTEHTLIYVVIYGKIHLVINGVSTIVETGDNFFIPRGTMYSLKNLRREIAKLHFVDMDDCTD